MRGDSLRDLYAKSLALVGLGVLAGIGALVDYWPAGVTVPRVDPRRPVPEVASARPATEAVPTVPLPASSVAVTPSQLAPEPVVVPDRQAIPVATRAAVAPLAAGAVTLDARPPMRTFVAPPVATVQAAAIPLSEPTFVEDETPRFLAAMPSAAGDEDGGFFSGATDIAKRAGSTILTTGSKAGASIVGGLAFVGRGLKKLKFF